GIGRALAVLYAREGADVGIVYLAEEEKDARETKQAVEAEGRRALLLPGDVRQPAFCKEAVEWTVRTFGKLDILVNNAAYQMHQPGLEAITDEQLWTPFIPISGPPEQTARHGEKTPMKRPAQPEEMAPA